MAEYVVTRDRAYGWNPGLMIERVLYVVFGVIQFMLALRLVLQILSASTASQFVSWVYSTTDTLMGPFAGAFPTYAILGGMIDLSVILAMIGYLMLSWFLSYLLSLVFYSDVV